MIDGFGCDDEVWGPTMARSELPGRSDSETW